MSCTDSEITIGASQVAAILGYSPFETPQSMWRKLVGIESDKEESALSKYRKHLGNLLEDDVLAIFQETTGKKLAILQPDTKKRRGIIHATPDAITEDGEIVEIKTSSEEVWVEVPYYYYVQIQVQLYVHDLKVAYLPALCRMNYECYTVEYNQSDAERFIEQVTWFYQTYVAPKIEPPPSYARALRKSKESVSVLADDNTRALLARYYEVRKAMVELEAELKDIREKLKLSVEPNGRLVDSEGNILASRIVSFMPGTVDRDALRKYYPDVYAEVVGEPRPVERLIIR